MERINGREVKKSNVIRSAIIAAGLGFAAIATACSSATQAEINREDMPGIVYTYHDNGMRESVFTHSKGRGYYSAASYCDGGDFIDRAFSANLERSVGHPACADGKLTESDFAVAK